MTGFEAGVLAFPDPPVPYEVIGTMCAGRLDTQIPFHSSAQPGDIWVLSMLGGWEVGDPEEDGYAYCTDSRATVVREEDNMVWGRRGSIYIGYVTENDPAPLSIMLRGTVGYAIGQFAVANLTVFRGIGKYLQWGLNRYATTPEYDGGNGFLPGLPGVGSGAIAVVFASGGWGGIYQYWDGAGEQYQAIGGCDASYVMAVAGMTNARTVLPSPGSPIGSGGWAGTVLGLR